MMAIDKKQADKEHLTEEAISKDQLIKLYNIALEEARHHDRLYTAVWTPGIVLIGILLTALVLLLREPTPVSKSILVWTIIGLGALVLLWFYWSICRHANEARKCRDICRNIENILAGKIPKETIKLDSLLVIGKVKEMRVLWDKDVWYPLADPPQRLIQPFLILVIWIGLGLILTGYIG